MSQRRLKCARDVPCLRKDGGVVYADIAVTHITFHDEPCLLGFFHDITEQKRAMEAIRASEERYRLIADNVADVIWTVEFSAGGLGAGCGGSRRCGDGRRDHRAVAILLCQSGRRTTVSIHARRGCDAFASRHYDARRICTRPRRDDRGVRPERRRSADASRQRIHRTGVSGQGRELRAGAKSPRRTCATNAECRRAPSESPATPRAAGRRKRPCASRKASCAACSKTSPTSCLVLDRDANILFVNHDQRNTAGNVAGQVAASPSSRRSIKPSAVGLWIRRSPPACRKRIEVQDVFGSGGCAALVPLG